MSKGTNTNDSDTYKTLVDQYNHTISDNAQTEEEKLNNAANFADYRAGKLKGKADKMEAD